MSRNNCKCGHGVEFHQIDTTTGKPKCIDCEQDGKSCNRFHPYY